MLASLSPKGRRLVAAYTAAGVCALQAAAIGAGLSYPGAGVAGWLLAAYFALLSAH